MSASVLSRSFIFAAAFAAACVVAPGDGRAEIGSGPVADRFVRLASPPNLPPLWLEQPMQPDGDPNRRVAQADCSGAAAEAAADSGGQVLSVQSRQQGGQTVCVVTVLVPGEDGGRPRKRTITIPQ